MTLARKRDRRLGDPVSGHPSTVPEQTAEISGSFGVAGPENNPPPRTGRRRGNPDTRQAIVDAASGKFAESGFTGATMRAIAASAGVDAALIHHYFGSKRELFLATVHIPFDPAELMDRIASDGLDGLGHRLVATITAVWESPNGSSLIAMVRSALSEPGSARSIREFFTAEIISRLLAKADVPAAESELRGGLVATQILGLCLARYVLELPPVCALPREQVIALVGPTVQRYVDGSLTGLGGNDFAGRSGISPREGVKTHSDPSW